METKYITYLILYLKFAICILSVASVSHCRKVQCCLLIGVNRWVCINCQLHVPVRSRWLESFR